MCGIVGVAAKGTRVGRDRLVAMRDTMSHRGPDDAGQWISPDDSVGLGHRRLSIIDLSSCGHQPMSDPRGEHSIVFNGEIYNFLAIRDDLEARGHRFTSRSDTEVILASYREWGVECVARFIGQFALVVYDGTRRQLFGARDRAGEKPFFYSHSAGALSFASELKALMADPEMPRRIDPVALDHYMAYGHIPGDICLLQGVKKLPPAHAFVYDIGSDALRIWRYWSLPSPARKNGRGADGLVDELDSLLEDAVRLQILASDVPVGVLLSGGVDSSLITAMAARVTTVPVRTFTIAFPGHGAYDEGPVAKVVASHFGTEHTELVAEPATVDLLPSLARQYDEPIGDSSMVPTYLVSRLVRQSCTVALGGDAGDELFGGYMHYSRIQNQMRVRRALPSVAKRAVGALAALLPTGVRGRTYLTSLAIRDSEAWAHANLLFDRASRRRLAPATRGIEGSPPEESRLRYGAGGVTDLQKMTTADFATYLPEDILVKVDRASMLTSLEVRAPFLDHRVIEFAFGQVPDRLRATATERKVVLKMLAKRLLPAELDLRRKQGFSLPLDAWFRGDWGKYIADVLLSAPAELFDPQEIRALLAGQRRGLANAQRLFNLAILELWRREYDVTIGAMDGTS